MNRPALCRILTATGLTDLRWRMLRPGLYCFNYHRIGNPAATPYDRGVFSCSQERLGEHVALLAERFTLLTLDHLLALGSAAVRRARKPFGLITFDDGYIDNYILAYPILKAHQAPAVFFVPTDFVGSARLPWWDEIAWLARSATVEQIQPQPGCAALDVGPAASEAAVVRLLQWVKRRRVPMAEQLAQLRELCRPAAPPASPAEALFVNWEQLREMQAGGMDIGSHTHSHPILSTLDAAGQTQELSISKSILESRLQGPVAALAYPVGSAATFTAETCRIAREVGYRIAFSFERHMNALPLEAPFAVGRYAVDDDIDRGQLRSMVAFPALA